MDTDELEIVEVAGSGDHGFLRAVYDTVLRPSFPTTELDMFEAFARDLAESPDGAVLVAMDADQPVGAVVDHPMPHLGLGLLSYAASRPGLRGRGIGATLMAALRTRWRNGPVEFVVAEVEDPRLHPETTENAPGARLRFYEREGADLLMVPWVQPGLGGRERVPGMLLLRVWSRAPARSVPSSTLVHWAESYYESEEGTIPSDETFLALRARLTEFPEVEASPIDRLSALRPLE